MGVVKDLKRRFRRIFSSSEKSYAEKKNQDIPGT